MGKWLHLCGILCEIAQASQFCSSIDVAMFCRAHNPKVSDSESEALGEAGQGNSRFVKTDRGQSLGLLIARTILPTVLTRKAAGQTKIAVKKKTTPEMVTKRKPMSNSLSSVIGRSVLKTLPQL